MTSSRMILFVSILGAFTGTACSHINLLTEGAEESETGTQEGTTDSPAAHPVSKSAQPPRRPSADSRFVGQVLDVHDGGTLTVLIGQVRERVRLIGVDSPELHEAPWGLEAFITLRQLVTGKVATLETDALLRDDRQRLQAYVFIDGTFINLEMIRRGHAQIAPSPPNVTHLTEFQDAQRHAQQAGVGLWDARPSRGPSLECLRTNRPGC
jgi:micrococcal nuclease